MYSSPTTAVGGGCRATGIPRRQAGLANREAILPSGEPLTRSFLENRSELRYNTSPQRSFAQIARIQPMRPPTHGAMRRAFKLFTVQKEKEPPTQNLQNLTIIQRCIILTTDMINNQKSEYSSFGAMFRSKRVNLGYTLRSFCERYDYDPGNISRLERDLLPPSLEDDILSGYAKALQISKGSEDWISFIDLAHIAKNKLPSSISNESRQFLPLLFRTIRGKQISKDKIEKIIELINES